MEGDLCFLIRSATLWAKRGAGKMSIFATLVICSWSKPYLELSDFPENWYGKSLQHILDAKNVLAVVSPPHPPPTPPWQQKSIFAVTAAPGADAAGKTFFASRICCKDLPYQFSGKSDNSKYGLIQLQITSVANILILSAPLRWDSKKNFIRII